ncbi:hypothetical protein ADUPG1_006846, partial [Aduncisulcus paluster]
SQLPAFAHLLSTHPFFTLALIPVLLRYTLALYQSYPPHAMFTGDSGVELGIVDPGINNVTLDSDADATVNGVEMGGTSSGRPAGEGLLASSPGLRPGQTKDIDDDRHDQSSGVDLGESTMISSDGDNDPIEMPPKDVVPDVIQDSTGEYDNESDSYGGPSCIPDWKRHVSGVLVQKWERELWSKLNKRQQYKASRYQHLAEEGEESEEEESEESDEEMKRWIGVMMKIIDTAKVMNPFPQSPSLYEYDIISSNDASSAVKITRDKEILEEISKTTGLSKGEIGLTARQLIDALFNTNYKL